jgi:4-aminobutyrate aminotransferase-like enzyme
MGGVHGKGLVAGVHIVKDEKSKEPDGDLAFRITGRMMEKGVLLFAPVGFGGATIKLAPPLCITKKAVEEGVSVLDDTISELT